MMATWIWAVVFWIYLDSRKKTLFPLIAVLCAV